MHELYILKTARENIVIRVKLYTDFTYLERPRTFVNPLFKKKCFLKVQNFVYITLYSRLKRTSDRYRSWQGRDLCLWSVLEKCIPWRSCVVTVERINRYLMYRQFRGDLMRGYVGNNLSPSSFFCPAIVGISRKLCSNHVEK